MGTDQELVTAAAVPRPAVLAPRAPAKGTAKKAVQKITSAARTKKQPPSDTDQQKNFLLPRFSNGQTDFTRAPLVLPSGYTVEQAPQPPQQGMDYPDGSRTNEKIKRERLTAVMGPGSTIFGVAQVIKDLINTNAQNPLTVEQVADGLTEYNSWVETPAGSKAWQVGVRLPLPIELPLNQPLNNQKLIVDAVGLRKLADARQSTAAATNQVVADLPLPDAAAVKSAVTAAITAPLSFPATVATQIAAAMNENPYLVVFDAIETLRQYAGGPADRSDAEVAFAQALLGEWADWQVAQLAQTTAANAVLRRVWRALHPMTGTVPATPSEVMHRVGDALGLIFDDDGTWHDPTFYFISDQERLGATPDLTKVPIGPSVVPLELPVAPKHQSMVGTTPLVNLKKGHDHAMVLGRDIDVGKRTTYKTWDGVENNGNTQTMNPNRFNAPGTFKAKNPAAQPVVDQRMRAVAAIAPAEGMLDSVRSADAGLNSFGIQQWTSNDNTEASTFLHRFRQVAPDHYDLYFGLYGLQTALAGTNLGKDEVIDPESPSGRPDALKANPKWPDKSPTMALAGPENVTFRVIRPNVIANHANTKLPAHSAARNTYFGLTSTRAGNINVLDNDWSARSRVIAFGSEDYLTSQMEFGALRFERSFAPITKKIPQTNKTPTLVELFNSEFGAAMYVDTHIHLPSRITNGIIRALDRTKGPALDPNGPDVLTAEWLERFVINFVVERHFEPNRNDVLLQTYDTSLSAIPGTWTSW